MHKLIRIPSESPYLIQELSRTRTRRRRRMYPLDRVANLYVPRHHNPPWPAVVISQGLGGNKPHREEAYGQWLSDHGYLAIAVDSFRSRGYRHAHDLIRALRVTEAMMLADACAALDWLVSQKRVDPDRVFNIGFSYGGMICFLTAYEQVRRSCIASDARFAGHISFYGCSIPFLEDPTTTGAPVTILIGDDDAKASIERFGRIAQQLRDGGSEVDMRVYPGTCHQWDGNDRKRRWAWPHLGNVEVKLLRDGRYVDPDNNREIRGFWSRTGFLFRHIGWKGFYIQRDDQVTLETSRILLEKLGYGEGAAMSGPATAPPAD